MRGRPETLFWGLLVLLGAGWLLLAGCGSESPPGPSGRGEGKQPAASQQPTGGPVRTIPTPPPLRKRAGSGEALPTLHVLLPLEPGQVGLTEAELRAGPAPLAENLEVGLTETELREGPGPAPLAENLEVGLTEAELRAEAPPLEPETFEVAPPGKTGERGLTQAEVEKLLRSQGAPEAVIEVEPEAPN